MSSYRPQPPFPLALDPLAPAGVVAALGPAALGAFYLLVRHAWTQDPPCTLPDDDTLLATIARMQPGEWAAVRPQVQLGCQTRRGTDPVGRLEFQAARQYQETLDAVARARRRQTAKATEAAALSKRGRSVTDPSRIRYGSVTDAALPLRPELSLKAPAPLRSDQPEFNPSAPIRSAQSECVIARVGAEARALDTAERRRRWCLDLLSRAVFPWAASHQRTVPHAVARELAEHPSATPMRVAYVIEQAQALGRKPQPEGSERVSAPNPIGLLIQGLGAGKTHTAAPWEVPIWFEASWHKVEAERERLYEAQRALEQMRSRAPASGKDATQISSRSPSGR